MVLKPDFREVRMEADYFLSKQNLTDPWIDAKKLDFGEKKIHIDSVQHYASLFNRPVANFTCESISGCEVIKIEDINLILYDENDCPKRINHGILHEVGHIYLEHKNDCGKNEVEAHFFASLITALDVALWYIYNNSEVKINVGFLKTYFNVSEDAAIKKVNNFNKMKNYYYPNGYEKKILSKIQSRLDDIIDECYIKM